MPWTTSALTNNTCSVICGCDYPSCPDNPDKPPMYCSLCGPKFNAPIYISFWYPAPPTIFEVAQANSKLSTLTKLLQKTNLSATLSSTSGGPFTVFAPTNDAFDRLPSDTLQKLLDPAKIATLALALTYHFAPQRELLSLDFFDNQTIRTFEGDSITVRVNEVPPKFLLADATDEYTPNRIYAKVIEADNFGSNGVVHVIDKVLLPRSLVGDDIVSNNLVQVVEVIPSLSTFAAAINADGFFAIDLSQGVQFTVFAPTNAAFSALPKKVLHKLLAPENQQLLQKVLSYHVVYGAELRAQDIQNDATLKMFEGTTLRTLVSGGAVFLQGGKGTSAEVLIADVLASNAVIHLIDSVLMPSDVERLF